MSKLGDACELVGGGTPSKLMEQYYEGNILWATVRDMKYDILSSTEHRITEEAVLNSSTNIIKKGNIITATRVGLGKVCVLAQDTAINQDLKAVIPKDDKLTKSFLFFWLKSIAHIIEAAGTGATVQGVKLAFVKGLNIPLPPIPEQKRIVAILDQAFADIDKARANAEQNLKNARELFESYLQQVFSQRGEGWVEKSLGETVVVERGSSPRPIKSFITEGENGVNWIKIGDVREGDKYVTSTKQKITPDGALKSRFVDIGDFILSNSMSFGRPYIMAIEGYIHDGWFVLRLPESLDPDYFYYLLSSPYVKGQFLSLAAGAIVKNISGDLVKQAVLPLPPLNEQKTIALKLDEFSKDIERLEEVYLNKINTIDELKKSILHLAFTGELTKDKAA